ncbi:MAG: hypothetical protein IT211_05935 [Armatimonadetes bacterium]|nr:hypothetical protein [Armatimonadota bacterium]
MTKEDSLFVIARYVARNRPSYWSELQHFEELKIKTEKLSPEQALEVWNIYIQQGASDEVLREVREIKKRLLETFPTEEKKAKPEPNNVTRLLPKESKFDSVREFLQSLAVHEPTGKLIWPYRQSDLKHFTESIIIPYVSNSEPNKFAANYFVWKDGKEFTSEGFGKVKKEAKLSPQTEQIINPVKTP